MGGKGEEAKNVVRGNSGVIGMKSQAEALNDPAVMQALQAYSSGGMSLQDALGALGKVGSSGSANSAAELQELRNALAKEQGSNRLNGTGALIGGALTGGFGAGVGSLFGGGPDKKKIAELESQIAAKEREIEQSKGAMGRAAQNELFINPLTGTLVATDQVKNNDLLKGVFGDGGMQDRMLAEEQDLAKRGWTLTPEDHEAYGQASNETARMFGQEENDLAKALASRGLASGASGTAGAAYSGLMGNKLERLAASQRKIADDRMQMNRQRLNDVRNLSLQTNQLAQAAIGDQFGRNREGVQDYRSALKDAATAGQIEQGQENTGFEQRIATQGPSVGDIAMGVLGTGLGTAAGGMGTSLGGGLGMALGGIDPTGKKGP